MVVDLRPLNRWTVPDSCPLPLQSDVVNLIRGKKYITVVDATRFFSNYSFILYTGIASR